MAPVFRSWQLSNPECVASLLTSRREWELLGECWFFWRDLEREINYRRFMGKVIEDDSDSECDSPRLSISRYPNVTALTARPARTTPSTPSARIIGSAITEEVEGLTMQLSFIRRFRASERLRIGGH